MNEMSDKKYDASSVEKKWQEKWEKDGLYKTSDDDTKKKFYCLDMFPYPSGSGIHVGHWRGWVLSDVIARYQMLNGKNVLHPMGWDAFGLPAENAAIKNKSHPKKYTEEAISNIRRQIKQIGTTIDWSREINTSSPEYYKWTQWLFTKLFEAGLAYKKKAPVNWCPSCQTVLANEQVVAGECERCGSLVTKKELSQWFFKITDFAEDLLNDLDKLDWPERTKIMQKNWIGRSDGVMVKFKLKDLDEFLEVFTTRPDTLFGATYMAIAPEHPLVGKLKDRMADIKAIENYIENAKKETDIEREATDKEKTGVFTGLHAINPINNKEIPVWISDYVLMGYGTGAIMAVPAHDERDYAFATKYDIPIIQVIAPHFTTDKGPDAVRADKPTVKRKMITAIVKHWDEDKIFVLNWEKFNWHSFILGGVDDGEKEEDAAKREVIEESGYSDIKSIKKISCETHSNFFAAHKDENRYSMSDCFVIELGNDKHSQTSKEHTKNHVGLWMDAKDIASYINLGNNVFYWNEYLNGGKCFEDSGVLINSGEFSGMMSSEAKNKIVESLTKDGVAEEKTNYRLRDWLVSRQRYWGAPIPIVNCPKCGEVAVPEKDLPVLLPEDIEFKPHGDSPLKQSESFVNTICPKCGGKAMRETDTMDTFVCSSWYYLRYTDPKNTEMISTPDKIKHWLPVDTYVGGIEHAILHLLYARFISKALTKLGIIDFGNSGEPFQKLFNIGMIYLHGAKMSKSKGNIVSPDEMIEKYGTDALRGYELFLGPAEMDAEWQVQGISGVSRLIEKIWDVYNGVCSKDTKNPIVEKTIKVVTSEIEEIRPNTAISHLMELFNDLKKNSNLSETDAGRIAILIAPFFPHLAEELWEKLGNNNSVFREYWPTFDESCLEKEEITIPVQINGKLREMITINKNMVEKEVLEAAQRKEKVKEALEGVDIVKSIYIPLKIVNFVIK